MLFTSILAAALLLPFLLLALFVFDNSISLLNWLLELPWLYGHSSPAATYFYTNKEGRRRTSIVFPGFSNPPSSFGSGMNRILGRLGPMVVVRYGNQMNFNGIYKAVMSTLEKLHAQWSDSPRQILVYGHSMGGQYGEQFVERYEHEGSIYGPVCELFLGCSPSTGRSLGKSASSSRGLRMLTKVYWGGVLGKMGAIIANLISRRLMPTPLAPEVSRGLYRRYSWGILLYPNRRLFAQLRAMLHYKPPAGQSQTKARVVYIAATNPQRDLLVNQNQAIADWRRRYSYLQVVQDPAIGHASPMEQPGTYTGVVESQLCDAVVG